LEVVVALVQGIGVLKVDKMRFGSDGQHMLHYCHVKSPFVPDQRANPQIHKNYFIIESTAIIDCRQYAA
jgi:hypothetical protein